MQQSDVVCEQDQGSPILSGKPLASRPAPAQNPKLTGLQRDLRDRLAEQATLKAELSRLEKSLMNRGENESSPKTKEQPKFEGFSGKLKENSRAEKTPTGSKEDADFHSILIERDHLKKDLSLLSNQILEKSEELRGIEAQYKVLLRENEELGNEVEKLRGRESSFDEKINECKEKLAEYRRVKMQLEEGDLLKQERLFQAQQRMEQNSARLIETELASIKKEIEKNDELAIHYLKKYIARLQKAT